MLEGSKEVCEMTGRLLTLRGAHAFTGTGISEEVVLTNSSPDRTKAWKVLDARIWVESNASTASAVVKTGSQFVISARLQTDTMRPLALLQADDNRCFGWLRSTYRVSDGASNLNNGQLDDMVVIDPDHVITDQMYATLSFSPDNVGEAAQCTICWLIVLEQIKIKPMESILQTVKGRSQDVGV